MEIVCPAGFPVSALRWRSADGREFATLLCKVTYCLERGESPLAGVQEPFGTRSSAESGSAPRALSTDEAPYKPRAEVVLVGSAFAPQRVPTSRVVVRLVAGGIDKSLVALGDRWQSRDGRVEEGATFVRMPIGWERALGGPDTWNPLGMGDHLADPHGRFQLPNLVAPGTSNGSIPVGFGPIPAEWSPRRRHAGRGALLHDDDVLVLPADLDPQVFQAAPVDQQIASSFDPDTRIVLENLHPEHERFVTNLAPVHAVASFASGYRQEARRLAADTLWIDTDASRCWLVLRAVVALSADEVLKVRVDTSTRGDDPAFAVGPAPARPATPSVSIVDHGRSMTAEISLDRDVTHAGFDILDEPSGLPFVPLVPPPSSPGAPSPPSPVASPLAPPLASPLAPPRAPPLAPPLVPPPAPPLATSPSPATAPPLVAPPLVAPPMVAPPMVAPPMVAPPLSAPPLAPPPLRAPLPSSPEPPPMRPSAPQPQISARGPSAPPPAMVLRPMGEASPSTPGGEPIAGAPAQPWGSQKAAQAPSALLAVRPELAGAPPSKPEAPAFRPARASETALAASNRAAGATSPAGTNRPSRPMEPREPAGSEPAGRSPDPLDLLWFEEGLPPKLRDRFRAHLSPRERRAVFAEASVRDDDQARRADVLRVLGSAPLTELNALEAAHASSVGPDGGVTPPLVLVLGDLVHRFEEREVLRAVIGVASPFGSLDKTVREAVEFATLVADSEWSGTATIDAAAARVRESLARVSRDLGPSVLDATVQRKLLERRSFRAATLLGREWFRADLATEGKPPVPLYIPAELRDQLPLFERLPVRALCELRRRQDGAEVNADALFIKALARRLTR